jgi:dienelactone hydrolase
MNPSAMKPIALFLMLAAMTAGLIPLSAQPASGITISGTITDPGGAKLKNAKVTLLGRNLTALTDADGVYTFAGLTTSLGREALSADAAPKVQGGNLRFSLHGGDQRVQVTLVTLAGRLAREVADARLDEGEYQVQPFRPGMAAGNYLLRVRIGSASHTLTIPHVDGIAAAQPLLQRIGSPQGPASLRKAAAVMDTLSVVAVGFERGIRTVEALSGTQDFKLNALKWANVPYRKAGQPACGRCIIDVRKPASGGKWPVIIHFHGGGMTGGDRTEPFTDAQYKQFGQKYLDHGLMVVMPGYTLAGGGNTVWPQYIRDAAQAAVWVRENIEAYGGDPNSVFISGFSAGAYLTHMLSIDTTWFKEANFDPRKFAGFISMSGQTRTHDNIRNDLKVGDIMKEKPAAMPMGHIRKTTIPWQITVGGNEGGTIGSNQDMYNALIKAGSTDLFIDIIPGQPHTCADIADANSPKRDKIFAFIDKYKGKGL